MPFTNNEQEITRQILLKANYDFARNFSLKLDDHEAVFTSDKVVRIIPGKRLVAFGRWNNQAVVAKIFFARQAKQHMQRDLRGAKALTEAKIPAPKVYYQGDAASRTMQVIIFERIQNAESLEDFWQRQQNSAESEPAMQALTLELATQHVMGLLQEDLHLKNFLWSGEKIYSIDGADIKCLREPLSKKTSIENLALLFSQLGLHTDKLQQRLFNTYVRARNWLIENADIQLLQKTIQQWNASRWLNYSKKIFRSSTQFGCIKKFSFYAIFDRRYFSKQHEHFLENPESFFNHPQLEVLKAGRSSTVVKVPIGERTFVVKRYNYKGLANAFKGWFKPSRAMSCWRLSHQLKFSGIPTANPIA
ncbi:MAG TPA: lipopolysaccharide kinase InaA family protein, partial [Gammaproteobacteria bacterium]|nr:lipopolysaccharide kinase InaA family protein [Gammaproteobacteria bacterium]